MKYVKQINTLILALIVCSISIAGMTDEVILWPIDPDGTVGPLIQSNDPLLKDITQHDFNPFGDKRNCGSCAYVFEDFVNKWLKTSGSMNVNDPLFTAPENNSLFNRKIMQEINNYCLEINGKLDYPNFKNFDEYLDYLKTQPDDYRAIVSGRWQEINGRPGHWFNVFKRGGDIFVYNPQQPFNAKRTYEFVQDLDEICACNTNSTPRGTGIAPKPKLKRVLVPKPNPILRVLQKIVS